MHKPFVEKENIKAVILVSGCDFGRCPVASCLRRALWPVVDKSVLQHLIKHISGQGIKEFVICFEGESEQLRQSLDVDGLDVKFLDESLPRGTAGCILDAAGLGDDEPLIVFHASIVMPPDVNSMLEAHQKADADMTIMFNPSSANDGLTTEAAQIYICQRSILDYIPEVGYCDIKEGLIPELIRAGKKVHAVQMTTGVGNFRSWREYLRAIGDFLIQTGAGDIDLQQYKQRGPEKVWIGADAKVEPSAKIFGPVVVCDRAQVSEDAIIFGPAIIGKNVCIGRGALVAGSVLWDGSRLGRNSEIHGCVVDYNAAVRDNHIIEDEVVTSKRNGTLSNTLSKVVSLADRSGRVGSVLEPMVKKVSAKLPAWAQPGGSRFGLWGLLGIGIVITVFVWSYWPTVVDLWGIWQRSDEYSCGLLVPFLAVYVLWSRRHKLAGLPIRPSMWGLFAFIMAQAFRGFGLFFWFSSAERLSLVLSVASLVLLLFGWRVFWKTATVLVFLLLMLPLPNRVHAAVMLPMQNLATTSAVFCLEMFGYAVIREGNIIHLNDITVAVAEACNGLRMVTAFFVIIGWVVLLVRRLWWEKLILMISSLPIALLCNTIRLTITAMAFTVLTDEKWESIFHDFGGYAMMPLALAVVVFEMWLLTRLTTVPETKSEEVIIRKSEG